MKLYTKVIIHRNWQDIEAHDLGEIELDQLPNRIRKILGNQNIGKDTLLIEMALWNETKREKLIKNNQRE